VKNSLLITALTASALLGAGPVTGASSLTLVDWNEPRSVAVSHQDLDLATTNGIQKLHRRIEVAVAKVCALPNAEQLAQRARVSACREIARRQAFDQAGRLIEAAQVSARAH
jgi:UrcA family protein